MNTKPGSEVVDFSGSTAEGERGVTEHELRQVQYLGNHMKYEEALVALWKVVNKLRATSRDDFLDKIEGLKNHVVALEQDARLPEDEYSRRLGFEEGWSVAHEPALCGHARANWKDPNFGTPEYDGDERCEFCAALASPTPRESLAAEGEREPVTEEGIAWGVYDGTWIVAASPNRLVAEEKLADFVRHYRSAELVRLAIFPTPREREKNVIWDWPVWYCGECMMLWNRQPGEGEGRSDIPRCDGGHRMKDAWIGKLLASPRDESAPRYAGHRCSHCGGRVIIGELEKYYDET